MKAISNCRDCQKPIEYEQPEEPFSHLKPTMCNACWDKRDLESQRQAMLARDEGWRRICPPEFQKTDLSHPSLPPREVVDGILNWPCGNRGLAVYGDNRRGKTRLCWMLLRRLIVKDQKRVVALTAHQFGMQCASAYAQGAEYAEEWFENLADTDVLFLDDIDKLRATDRAEIDLFEILSRRLSYGLPVIVTTNATGKILEKKFTPERGPAIVARLVELCDPLKV
jgi:DNA replication protein DnaC